MAATPASTKRRPSTKVQTQRPKMKANTNASKNRENDRSKQVHISRRSVKLCFCA